MADQIDFLLSGQLFDLILAAHRLLFGRKLLGIDQLDGSARRGVFRSRARVVGGKALVEIVCPTAVKGAVGAFQDVSIIWFVILAVHGVPVIIMLSIDMIHHKTGFVQWARQKYPAKPLAISLTMDRLTEKIKNFSKKY